MSQSSAPASVGAAWAAARADRQAYQIARQDLNRARLEMHRAELNAVVERTKADVRKELAMEAMHNVVEVDSYVRTIAGGREALEMTLREMQMRYNQGETARIIKRAFKD